jgi:hypothetical protein
MSRLSPRYPEQCLTFKNFNFAWLFATCSEWRVFLIQLCVRLIRKLTVRARAQWLLSVPPAVKLKTLHIFPVKCIHVSHLFLHYKQRLSPHPLQVAICNREELCSLWGSKWIFILFMCKLRPPKFRAMIQEVSRRPFNSKDSGSIPSQST